MMKYYSRTVTKRVPINRFGKLRYRPYLEVVLTDNIDEFNYHKKIKFCEMGIYADTIDESQRSLILEPNKVYEFEKEW